MKTEESGTAWNTPQVILGLELMNLAEMVSSNSGGLATN